MRQEGLRGLPRRLGLAPVVRGGGNRDSPKRLRGALTRSASFLVRECPSAGELRRTASVHRGHSDSQRGLVGKGAFSPSEVDFFAGRFGMSIDEVLKELVRAGLDSIPGGGGEILVQEVRDRVAKKKAGADRWLEVMEVAHRQGLKTSVTMMYGLGETDADRIEHLFRVREVQGRTGGFTAFICWPLQPEHTELEYLGKTDAVTYLRTQAIARIVLGNLPNIQASWVTMGPKIGQVALRFGANDFGSLMMEENVVSAAGTTWRMTLPEMQRIIADAGYTPRKRKQDYTLLSEAA